MKKHLLLIIFAGVACVSACSDDASHSVSIDDACSVEGITQCSPSGDLMVCRGGFYVSEACQPGTICYAGECTDSCNAETYKVSCYGTDSQAVCGDDGKIVPQKCKDGNICHKGHCVDASLEKCDIHFEQQCRDDNSFLTCQYGFIVNHRCAEGLTCSEGMCVAVQKCDDATYQASCISDMLQKACINGVESLHTCPEGQRCLDGDCTTSCPDGYSYCSEDDTIEYACENGQLVSRYCNVGMYCHIDGCPVVETCEPNTFTTTCSSDTTKKYCDPVLNIIKEEQCSSGQACFKGTCVSDVPCTPQNFTPECASTSTIKICDNSGSGFTTFEDCKSGETCENGICQTFTESCTTGDVECASNKVKRECIDGIWHSSYCDIGTQICSAGACISTSDAVACINSNEVSCDGDSIVKCEYGYFAKYPCEPGKHCDLGKCYDNVSVGDTCDTASFEQQCLDTEKVLVCHDNVVTELSCGTQMCKAGACVDKSCNADSFKQECTAETKYTACESEVVVEKTCETNHHCTNGTCLPDANEGDPCNESTFVKSCTTEGKLAECVESKVTFSSCSEDNSVCYNGACVACDPTDTTKTCSENAVRECNAAGDIVETACTGDNVCYLGNCTECDPTKTTNICTDNKLKTCNASGKFDETDCPEGYKCEDNACTDVCTSDDDCKVDHYVCKESKCTFEPECALTDPAVCTEDGKSIKQCQAPGLFAETACAETEVCKNGVCIGNECDPDTYGVQCKSDNKTVLICMNGYLKENNTCAGICKDGTCVDCVYGETPLSCKGTSVVVECTTSNTYKQYACDVNSECKDGKGCVSKCGEDFADHCDENKRVYCNAGTPTTEECDYRSTCEEGQCINRTGTPCVPVIYDNTCHDNAGTTMIEYCDSASSSVRFGTCTGSNFCGELNGVTDCYNTCTQADMDNDSTWCVSGLDGNNYIGKCTNGTDYKGNPAIGIYRNAAICDNGNSVSCRKDTITGHNEHIVFDYLSCGKLGGNTCSMGSCAFASCETASAACNDNVATNCMYDPAYDNGSGGLVSTIMNCADIGGTCVVYNPDGVNRATCAVTDSVFTINGVENQPVSSLGTCYGKDLYKLNWSTESEHSIRIHTCKTECVTETIGTETYAYCK
ncbi:MAG: hypothetical protein J6A01_07660 [Proteobacteria bacterium]|nr:hypothetical protein [Pseudomonadota bacterium]